MKTLVWTAVAVLTLSAGSLFADGIETVLTPDSVLYTTKPGAHERLDIQRRNGEANQLLIVPDTEDAAIESQAHLIWDTPTSTLFVVWNRVADDMSEIRVARLNAAGEWTAPVAIASRTLMRRMDLQVVLTHAPADVEGEIATLLHAAWWSVGPTDPFAEYALVAFQNGELVSADVETVEALDTALSSASLEGDTPAPALHPPLAMVRHENGVEIAYGAPRTTVMRRILLAPKIEPNARMWRPGRSGGTDTPRSPFKAATYSAPVHAFISAQGRVVVYAPDAQFRYAVFDGKWSEVRKIKLDENLTSDQFLDHLKNAVDEMAPSASSQE